MKPYYRQHGFTIYHADNRDVLPFLKPCDLVLTDPPYAEQTHKGTRTRTIGAESKQLIKFDSVTADDLRIVFEMCGKLCSKWHVSFMDWRHISDLEKTPPDGLRFVRFGIWIKPNGAPQLSGDRPATGWEGIAIMHGAEGKMEWNGGGSRAVWTATKENKEHPTTKPVTLLNKLLHLFSDDHDKVIDPFMGGGSTAIACFHSGRRFVGIELDERYCEIAVQRLENCFRKFPLLLSQRKTWL